MALRAGVAVADVEFMQFHPTALHHPAMPRPLLSEALRGHGALLRDGSGQQFVDELAPRDVVSRAMAKTMAAEGSDHLWLDATGLEEFDLRFPNLAASLAEIGIDPGTEWIPIAPAAHHLAGGIITDLDGATSLPGLWAAGEVACSGVHGANRLASNSLLEGMVFGARVAEQILADNTGPDATGVMRPLLDAPGGVGTVTLEVPAPLGLDQLTGDGEGSVPELRSWLQRAMTTGAGVVRSAASMAEAAQVLAELDATLAAHGRLEPAWLELANLVTVGQALLAAATARAESRGNHVRAEYDGTDEAWRVRQVLTTTPR